MVDVIILVIIFVPVVLMRVKISVSMGVIMIVPEVVIVGVRLLVHRLAVLNV